MSSDHFENRTLLLPLLGAIVVAGLSCFGEPTHESPGMRESPQPPLGSDGGFFLLPDGGTSDPDAVCAKLMELRCGALERCGAVELETDAGTTTCQEWLVATECGPSSWAARVRAGTVFIDRELAESCAMGWLSNDCAHLFTEPEACATVIRPAKSLGGACYGGAIQECREGICRGTGCPRTCRALGGESDSCSADADCSGGLYCALSTNSDLGACARYGALEDTCAGGYRCAPELFCGTSQKCLARVGAGEPCVGEDCQRGFFCDPEQSGGTCQEQIPAGDPCSRDVECGEGAFCDPFDSRCASAKELAEGEECSLNQRCAEGLTCVGATPIRRGACGTGGNESAPCMNPSDCAEHLGCNTGDAGRTVCTRRLPDESACDDARDCLLTSVCFEGSCRSMGLQGDACDEVPCLYGACDQGECIGFAAPNAECSRPEDCVSGSCVSGRCLAVCAP